MKHRLLQCLFAMTCLIAASAIAQTKLKSPQDVETGLRMMNQALGRTGQLITSQGYDQVPRAGSEFTNGVNVLRQGMTDEPAAFKHKVEPLIEHALKTSKALNDAAKSGDESMIGPAHTQFAAAVNSVIDAFPEELRPKVRHGKLGNSPAAGS